MLAFDDELLLAHVDRLAQALEHPLGDVDGLLRALHLLDQDGELVAAEAGDRVGRADGVAQAMRDLLQHRVAGGMAEAVVDRLEVVEVDEDHAHRRLLAGRAGERVADAIGEERAVGEARDGIVEGLVRELVLEELALADVAAVEDDALHATPPPAGCVWWISNWSHSPVRLRRLHSTMPEVPAPASALSTTCISRARSLGRTSRSK